MWTQGRLALELFFNPPDVFLNPEQILPLFAPTKSVITVHDLAFEIYPQYYPAWHRYYLHKVTKRSVKRAKRIIAVSERTKRDVAKCYGIPLRSIEVIHHGFSSPARTRNDLSIASEIQTTTFPFSLPYLLFLGRIEYKKNLMTLIDAFGILAKELGQSFSLVLAGSDGFGASEIRERAKQSWVSRAIHFPGYVNKEQKYLLYRHASAFVFPSWYEGFGLPILEAQSFGVPVVASNTSSLPEVAGEGALFVDPQNPESIADGIFAALTKIKTRQILIRRGYQNLERFSWQTSARQTIKVLTNL